MYVAEYKKKLYSFQENAEQMEGFQTQEMAKIKHLVSTHLFVIFGAAKLRLILHMFAVTRQRTRSRG